MLVIKIVGYKNVGYKLLVIKMMKRSHLLVVLGGKIQKLLNLSTFAFLVVD